MKLLSFKIVSMCLIAMAYLASCKKTGPVPTSDNLPQAPAPNSTVKKPSISNIKSFSLVKDLYNSKEGITFSSQIAGRAHLWIFGDRMISKEASITVNFEEAGIVPVKHIVTINDTLKNEYLDTVFVGSLFLKSYIIYSISYPNVQIELLTSGTHIGSGYTGSGYRKGVFPFKMSAFNTAVYSYAPVTIQLRDDEYGIVEKNTVNLNTVHKVVTSYNELKLLCLDQNGNNIWAEFEMR